MPLAKRINLARTSFYWFFKDREALLEGLIDLWREKNTGCIAKQASAYAESVTEALFNVVDCWPNPELFDSKFEFVVRSRALQSPQVAADILHADKVRIEALTELFARHGNAPAEADVIADIELAAAEWIDLGPHRAGDEMNLGNLPLNGKESRGSSDHRLAGVEREESLELSFYQRPDRVALRW